MDLNEFRLVLESTHDGNGEYHCFEVKGNTMNDNTVCCYVEGEILLCNEFDLDESGDKIARMLDHDFVILDRKEGYLLRRIAAYDNETDTFTLRSLNGSYPDIVTDFKNFVKIFIVHASIKSRKL